MSGGREALEEAKRRLDETRDQWREINQMDQTVKRLKRRNHFAEQLEYIMRSK